MTKNQTYTVSIDNASPEGFGICRIEGQAVFVNGALPGERWEILILKVTKTAVWAKGLKLLQASPHRITPDCPNPCGGCSMRHADYAEELRIKREHVESCLRRIGGLTELPDIPIHPSPHPTAVALTVPSPPPVQADATDRAESAVTAPQRYRNKAVFAVAPVNGKACFGFYRPRSHDLIPVEDCLLQSEPCIRDARVLTQWMNDNGIPAYDEESGKGTVRHIFRRESATEAVLCIVTARGFGSKTANLTDVLRASCPELTGIVLNVNKSKGNAVLSGDFYTLWGNPDIHQSFCGVDFEVSPQAFLQVNPPQAEAIYRKVAEYALSGENEKSILDLYCGTGTISLCLAKAGAEVTGVEIVPGAVENARKNAERNGLHARFLCCDSADLDPERHFDAVVVDPPRKGLGEKVIEDLARIAPDRIIYVSCNPATLARDLKILSERGYMMKSAEAYDMFPRTAHVETVVLMSRKDS